MRHFHRRRRAGFTLPELTVVLIVAGMLFALATTFLVTVAGQAGRTSASEDANRDATYALNALSLDLASLSVCDAYSRQTPIRSIENSRLAFWADVLAADGSEGADGEPDLVVWRLQGQRLQRAVAAGPCPSPTVELVFVTVAEDVTAGTTGLFTAHDETSTPLVASGVCEQSAECLPASIDVRFTVQTSQAAVDARRRIELETTRSRLTP